MKKSLFLSLGILLVNLATAQYTLSYDGNPVTDGQTIIVSSNSVPSSIGTSIMLHSETSDLFRLKRTNVDFPNGAKTDFCVGNYCYDPNFSLSAACTLGANNEAELHFGYYPKGNNSEALASYKVYQEGNENVNITFNIKYVFNNGSSVNNVIANSKFKAYPNPAINTVNFFYEINTNSEIAIYNIVGEQVANYKLALGSNTLQIDISDLPSGTYFYSLIIGTEKTKTKRLTIRK